MSPFWPIRVWIHPALLIVAGVAIGAWIACRRPPVVQPVATQPVDQQPWEIDPRWDATWTTASWN